MWSTGTDLFHAYTQTDTCEADLALHGRDKWLGEVFIIVVLQETSSFVLTSFVRPCARS